MPSWNGDDVFDRVDDPHNSPTSMALIQDRSNYYEETVTGTSGNDLIIWSGVANGGTDFIDGGNGKDILSINAYSSKFSLQTKASGITYLNEESGGESYGNGVLVDIEKIEFLDKTVTIGSNTGRGNSSGGDNGFGGSQDGWPNDIIGTINNDTLTGRGRDDYLWGDRGDDVLRGRDGDDLLVGGKGNDTLIGGSGEDFFLVSKKMGKGFDNGDLIKDFEVGEDVLMVSGNTKKLWIDNYKGDAVLVRGKDDVIAWIEDAGGQIGWGGSDGNLIF